MDRNAKIYIAGHRGLVGSAIMRRLQAGGYSNLITRGHTELDLTDQQAVQQFYAAEKPGYVFIAAAKVGGIHANNTYPADFIYQNLMIECNLIHGAYQHGVKKLLFLGSTCIYPKLAPQPMKEEHLLTGPLEPTNEPYAVAKIAGIKMCSAYNRQYGTNFMSVMPTNLYGPNDNYHPQDSHVLPALIRRMHEAKERGDKQATVWGTGNARREFMASDDMADACLFLMERFDAKDLGEFINIGVGCDMTIREVVEVVARVVGFEGELVFDTSKPDGAPRKFIDSARLTALGWQPKTGFEEGLRAAYQDFLRQLEAGTVRL
ncbi:MAG: GDP-fucose synthetase [Betaproteobacteria bacterium RBG_19FT_COMBO_58_11]|nr:MAG: GDP-fucose synthetase [Betaproteobacteria bacterium RBG_19FT_COMBO_58_11]